MSTETDRQSHRKSKRDRSLTDHMDATDFFPPGVGWNKDAANAPEPQRQDARPSPQSPIEHRQH
jgi:hypothetical protein